MANRPVTVGDTYPDVLFQVKDETGILNLSTAAAILVKFIGLDFEFSGSGLAIQPATADPNGVNFWNLHYIFATGDTAAADGYTPYVTVTWSAGKIQTFTTTDTLTVKSLPVPA